MATRIGTACRPELSARCIAIGSGAGPGYCRCARRGRVAGSAALARPYGFRWRGGAHPFPAAAPLVTGQTRLGLGVPSATLVTSRAGGDGVDLLDIARRSARCRDLSEYEKTINSEIASLLWLARAARSSARARGQARQRQLTRADVNTRPRRPICAWRAGAPGCAAGHSDVEFCSYATPVLAPLPCGCCDLLVVLHAAGARPAPLQSAAPNALCRPRARSTTGFAHSLSRDPSAINAAFGIVISVACSCCHSVRPLWGALSFVLRYIPILAVAGDCCRSRWRTVSRANVSTLVGVPFRHRRRHTTV